MIFQNTFHEIAAILGLSALIGAIGQKLRQPLIIMFLASGVIAGPAGLGFIESHQQIEILAHIGIALLLFIVGLRLDLNLIRTTGPVALATGLGQILFTSIIGFFVAWGLGMDFLGSAYVAVVLTFSSTIIIVKLLSDKKEIDSLHGRIAVGFLIVQDIAAIIALVGLTTFGSPLPQGVSPLMTSIVIGGKGIGLLLGTGLMMRFVLPPLLRKMAGSQELLNIFAITWAILLGAFSDFLGFSKEVGAFLAGVSLASSEYRDAIGARLTGLRDFLLHFFFIDLGARLDWSTTGSQLWESALFSVFVLIGNPIIVLIIMGFMGYRRRTAFLAGLTVAQISEFSLIVAALGLNLGHISKETMGLITLVGIVTIFASTYMILYSESLYQFLSKPLKLFERKNPFRDTDQDTYATTPFLDFLIIGLGNYGGGLAEHLLERNKKLAAVDFDPRVLEKWRRRNLPVLYGDIGDPELYEHLPLQKTHWVVSTIRNRALNLSLLNLLKQHRFPGKIALTAASPKEAQEFSQYGVQVVLRPFSDAAEQGADALAYALDIFPPQFDWPLAFREIRLKSGSVFSGKPIRDIPLKSSTDSTILALIRAGQVLYNPEPDLILQTGDRLLFMGTRENLKHAEVLIGEINIEESDRSPDQFVIDEILIPEGSDLEGKTLADLQFRSQFSIQVIGIGRGDKKITPVDPQERLFAGDRQLVLAERKKLKNLKTSLGGPLKEACDNNGIFCPVG